VTLAITEVLREVHVGEVDLEHELRLLGERHKADAEIHHTALDLARWSLLNREDATFLSERFGKGLDDDLEPTKGPNRLRERAAELLGRRPESGLLLLRDLYDVHLLATGNSVLWTALGQAAKERHDTEMRELVDACHERTNRQATWALSMVKVVSPQVLTAV
jgi:hypothetical protein